MLTEETDANRLPVKQAERDDIVVGIAVLLQAMFRSHLTVSRSYYSLETGFNQWLFVGSLALTPMLLLDAAC